MPARVLLFTMLLTAPMAARADDLIVLLKQRNCPGCQLADVDLVHIDLRGADLRNAKLMRANLGQAQLAGANLSGADLSFTSLRGASLRGADLTNSRLFGTDLRQADLNEARLSPGALEEAHWQDAKGISNGSRSHAVLHNAGVEAFQAGQWLEAERLFSDAIRSRPNEPLSWVARGISRSELAKDELAATDFNHAASLYREKGEDNWSLQLTEAANHALQNENKIKATNNNPGGKIIRGAFYGIQLLAPLAAKAILPIGIGF